VASEDVIGRGRRLPPCAPRPAARRAVATMRMMHGALADAGGRHAAQLTWAPHAAKARAATWPNASPRLADLRKRGRTVRLSPPPPHLSPGPGRALPAAVARAAASFEDAS
jgi:hypothetical protein